MFSSFNVTDPMRTNKSIQTNAHCISPVPVPVSVLVYRVISISLPCSLARSLLSCDCLIAWREFAPRVSSTMLRYVCAMLSMPVHCRIFNIQTSFTLFVAIKIAFKCSFVLTNLLSEFAIFDRFQMQSACHFSSALRSTFRNAVAFKAPEKPYATFYPSSVAISNPLKTRS